ncbi:MAG: hypothetical protein IH614_10835 [Desulfuromonadales bacterium]|nr:hypothetical protein [Desulfuromonadales bacterium]
MFCSPDLSRCWTILLLLLLLALPAYGFESDDFNQANLDLQRWTFSNPRGDGSVRTEGAGSGDARLVISVPAGTPHDIWTDGAFAPRLMQPCPSGSFSLDAKFDSPVGAKYQTQGFLVEETGGGLLRFELLGDGSRTRLYVAEIRSGKVTVRADRSIFTTPPFHLRLERNAERWRLLYSPDGTSWSSGADFAAAAAGATVGVYAGNSGSPAPAHTALIDYVFDTAAPIVPEDGSGGLDLTAPTISNISITPRTTSLVVDWTTDEPAGGSVFYGLTSACELGSVTASSLTLAHSVELVGLRSDTRYYLRVEAWDADGNRRVSNVVTTRTAAPPAGCRINPWYGLMQVFGDPGSAQRWVNLLGNLDGCADLASLSYRLNGGSERALSVGPDGRRLASPGDFNADIDFAQLVPGSNRVELIARDLYGGESRETVTIDYPSGQKWPLPYQIDWRTAGQLPATVQVVDGLWQAASDGVRPTILGYDRLLAIGDSSWRDYEVTVPLTVMEVDPAGFNPISTAPGLGLQMRWNGHTTSDGSFGQQPLFGWRPVGASAWFGWGSKKFKLLLNGRLTVEDSSGLQLQIGTTYWFKMRVETLATGEPVYRFKVWPASQGEPGAWLLTGTGLSTDPVSGSLLLVAHHTDVRFGEVNVRPLSTAPVTYTLTVSTSGQGTVARAPDRATYSAGEEVVLTAQPASGWRFSGWSGDLQGALNPAMVVMDRNRSVSATFVQESTTPAPPYADEFDGSSLNGSLWTLIDPRGDATVTVSGGRLSIGVPAGVEHDLWTSGNYAPRLLQPAPAGDFEVAAKFDSEVRSRYQMQGIVVEAETGRFLRVELMGDGSATRLFVASVRPGSASVKVNRAISGGAPKYLRLKRTGDSWSVWWSADGSSWTSGVSFTEALSATAVGLYAGNATPNPAHTALVDWFRTSSVPPPADTTAPVISGVALATGATQATIAFTTNEPAQGAVAYGLTEAVTGGRVENSALVTAHSLTLDALAPDSRYYFRLEARDAAGNQRLAAVDSFRTTAAVTYTLAVSVSGQGLVSRSPDRATYSAGEQVVLTAQAASGWRFSGWSGDLQGSLNPETVVMDRSRSVSATFVQESTIPAPPHGDEFAGSSLNASLWTLVDPHGDATVNLSGGRLSLGVPAGVEHDLWTTGNHAPRLLQPAPAGDFEVAAKFDSEVRSRYQMQGIVVEAEPGRFLRFELMGDGSATRLFVASVRLGAASVKLNRTITSGAPRYLRVKRAGSVWSVWWSADGTNWTTGVSFTEALSATALGLYAGNAIPATGQPSPAHTALIDWFRRY